MLRTGLTIAALAAFAAGCGGDEENTRAAAPATPKSTPAQLAQNPHTITCRDTKDVEAALEFRGPAMAKLAATANVRGMHQKHAAQSIWYAITEVCKGKPESYKPTKGAIDGVKAGKYRTGVSSP